MWGSLAALDIMVVPSAFTAASIKFIVAPTDAKSRFILVPISLSAVIINRLSFSSTFAPSASKPFKCKLIGLAPIEHPPGKYISTFLNLLSNAPIK